MTTPLAVLALGRIFAHDRVIGFVQANSFTFWAYLPAYFVAAIALAARRWMLAVVAAAIVACHLVWVLPDYRGADPIPAEAAGAPHLRLFTANLYLDNHELGPIIEEIRQADPDLLLLQEFSVRAQRAIEGAGVVDSLPYRVIDTSSGIFGTAIYSRFPLSEGGTWREGHTPMTRATVNVQGRRLRVYNVHTSAPSTPDGFKHWNDDLRALVAAADTEPGTLMLAGDFNANQHHRWYERLKDVPLDECHEARGRGNATTWPNNTNHLPGIRLDHVFVSRGAVCLSIREGRGKGSDHKPVIAEIALLE
ncbi:MAG: endonuclease/exonuclease/phosphatase family protein [Chloroflexi bacterium]|nr:endonuclease/exonuclease/phosphatase family protein [Chloroflexota bacterium]